MVYSHTNRPDQTINDLSMWFPNFFTDEVCHIMDNLPTGSSEILLRYLMQTRSQSLMELVNVSCILRAIFLKRYNQDIEVPPDMLLDDLSHGVQTIPFKYPDVFPLNVWHRLHRYSLRHQQTFQKSMFLSVLVPLEEPVDQVCLNGVMFALAHLLEEQSGQRVKVASTESMITAMRSRCRA